jgi:glycosyltransferase involved in cell wall biosynthesis
MGVRLVADLPSLSVILPTYNECAWLPDTIQAIDRELAATNWPTAEIIVVNDGSSDETIQVLNELETQYSLTVVTQTNLGRFSARLRGLEASTSDFVLLIDSRVHINPGALKFLSDQFDRFPERIIWNGDVDIANSAQPPAAFWLCLTRLAWRRYFRSRTLTSFDLTDFDYYPKGTTFFVAPRHLLLQACLRIDSHFADKKLMNDDTLLIRPLSQENRIYISPDFRCTYFSRDTTKKFREHTFHRGTVFVDAYIRQGSRYLSYLWIMAIGLMLASLAMLIWPVFTLFGLLALAALPVPIFKRLRLSYKEIFGFYRALPHFVPMYAAGLTRGLYLMARSRLTNVKQ